MNGTRSGLSNPKSPHLVQGAPIISRVTEQFPWICQVAIVIKSRFVSEFRESLQPDLLRKVVFAFQDKPIGMAVAVAGGLSALESYDESLVNIAWGDFFGLQAS